MEVEVDRLVKQAFSSMNNTNDLFPKVSSLLFLSILNI